MTVSFGMKSSPPNVRVTHGCRASSSCRNGCGRQRSLPLNTSSHNRHHSDHVRGVLQGPGSFRRRELPVGTGHHENHGWKIFIPVASPWWRGCGSPVEGGLRRTRSPCRTRCRSYLGARRRDLELGAAHDAVAGAAAAVVRQRHQHVQQRHALHRRRPRSVSETSTRKVMPARSMSDTRHVTSKRSVT